MPPARSQAIGEGRKRYSKALSLKGLSPNTASGYQLHGFQEACHRDAALGYSVGHQPAAKAPHYALRGFLTSALAMAIYQCNRVGANQARLPRMVPKRPSPPPNQTKAMTPVTTEAEANTIAS